MTEKYGILLTSGILKDEKRNRWKPDLETHMRVLAMGTLYSQGEVQKIIVTGGYLMGNENPSLAEVASIELQRKYRVPSNDITLEEGAFDLMQNAKNTADLLEEIDKIPIVVTNEWQASRAKKSFEISGLEVEVYSAEEVLVRNTPGSYHTNRKYFHFVNKFRSSPRTRLKFAKSYVSTLVLEHPLIWQIVKVPWRGQKKLRRWVDARFGRHGQTS